MNFFKSKLAMMALTLASILSFPTAANAGQYTNDIQQLYVAYFGRPADTMGLNSWEQVLAAQDATGQDKKQALASVADAFAQSAEFKSQASTPEQTVNQFFQNMFGHKPDAAALANWTSKLASGALTTAQLVQAIIDAAAGSDKDTFTNKVTAATAFTNGLDTTAKILGYSGAAAGNRAKGFINSITDNASLKNAVAAAELDKTIEKIINENDAPQSTVVTTHAENAINDTVTTVVNHVIGTAVTTAVIGAANAAAAGGLD